MTFSNVWIKSHVVQATPNNTMYERGKSYFLPVFYDAYSHIPCKAISFGGYLPYPLNREDSGKPRSRKLAVDRISDSRWAKIFSSNSSTIYPSAYIKRRSANKKLKGLLVFVSPLIYFSIPRGANCCSVFPAILYPPRSSLRSGELQRQEQQCLVPQPAPPRLPLGWWYPCHMLLGCGTHYCHPHGFQPIYTIATIVP